MWFWLAFGSALLGSVNVILDKQCLKKVSAPALSWAIFTIPLPFLLFFVVKSGIPSLSQLFYVGVLGSAISFVFSKTLNYEVLQKHNLSKVFPLTSFSGIFTYVLGLIFLSETIRPLPLAGLFTVIIGSYVLNLDQAQENWLKPFKMLFADKTSLIFLFSVLLNSISSIFDKMGVIHTLPLNPTFALFAENLCMSIILTTFLLKKQPNWLQTIKQNMGVVTINAVVFQIMSLLIFYAFTGGPVALIMGIKRLQIFFILLLSYLFFKDKPKKHVWFASFIMALGVLLIKIG
jgi:uncharacterized membrane protein